MLPADADTAPPQNESSPAHPRLFAPGAPILRCLPVARIPATACRTHPGLEDLVLERIQAFFTARDLRLEHIQLVSGSFLFDLPQLRNGVSLDKACSDAVVLLSFVCLMLGIADGGFELLVIFAAGKLSKGVQGGRSNLSSAFAACYRQLVRGVLGLQRVAFRFGFASLNISRVQL